MVDQKINLDILNAVFSEERQSEENCASGIGKELCEYCKFFKEIQDSDLIKLFKDAVIVNLMIPSIAQADAVCAQLLRIGMKYQQSIYDQKQFDELEQEFKKGGGT